MRDASPLRYPGGKWRFSDFLSRLIKSNGLAHCPYIEPYAGGASMGLSLLFQDVVSEIHLNDLDPAIYAFWHSVVHRNRDFIDLLAATPISTDEWKKQKLIYARGLKAGRLELGFATFFLNRTNHSGILNGGMIGGKAQRGKWKIDARFNVPELRRRIERIGTFKHRIFLYQQDALKFLKHRRWPRKSLKYLDPPYYSVGNRLYLNGYSAEDHALVSRYVLSLESPWVVSYDNVVQVRNLYRDVRSRRMTLLHTARAARMGKEILFFAHCVRIPSLQE